MVAPMHNMVDLIKYFVKEMTGDGFTVIPTSNCFYNGGRDQSGIELNKLLEVMFVSFLISVEKVYGFLFDLFDNIWAMGFTNVTEVK